MSTHKDNLIDLGRSLATPMAKESKNLTKQVGNELNHNSKSQGVNTRSTPDKENISSLMFNPAKVQEVEKFEVLQDMAVKFRNSLAFLGDKVLEAWVPAIITGWATHLPPTFGLALTKALGTIVGVRGELGAVRTLNKDVMVNGWKLNRNSDIVANQAKALVNRGETVIHNEAPVVVNTGSVVSTTGYVVSTAADIRSEVCREAISKISNVYGIESDFLTALIKTAAVIKSAGDVSVSANGTLELTSVGDLKLKSGGKLIIESFGGIEAKTPLGVSINAGTALDLGAAGTLTAQSNMLMLHGVGGATLASSGVAAVSGAVGCMPMGMAPIPPFSPGSLVPSIVVPPIPNIGPDLIDSSEKVGGVTMVEGTQGMGPVGGPII